MRNLTASEIEKIKSANGNAVETPELVAEFGTAFFTMDGKYITSKVREIAKTHANQQIIYVGLQFPRNSSSTFTFKRIQL